MISQAYAFPSEAVAIAAIKDYPPFDIDIIGDAYLPAPEGQPPEKREGFFVNAVWEEAEAPAWASARIPIGQAPRWWAGLPVAIPAPVLTIESYVYAIKALLDRVAAERDYDSAVSIATYVASGVPKFRGEALAFVAWRDAVFVHAYELLANVQAAKIAPPALDEFIAGLPAISWPA